MTTSQAIRAADARRARRRRRLIAYGQWQPFVDAQPARAHLIAIRATGMSLASISKHTGVNIGSIDHLLYGKAPYPPAAKIRPENADAILSYWPALDDYDDGAIVDGLGTRRRSQALAAAGWPSKAIHAHVNHISQQAVEHLHARERVTARTARAVRDFYRQVSEQRPEDHGVTPWIARRTRNLAAKRDYVGPAAWDEDTIDDPDAQPYTGEEAPLSKQELGAYRRQEIAHLAAFNVPEHEIADRLGMARAYVHDLIRDMGKAA